MAKNRKYDLFLDMLLSLVAPRFITYCCALPVDLERPLLALATHPRLGRPVLGAIKAGYRVSQRWRRRA